MNPALPAQIEALFARCPALCGFSVRDIEGELEVDHIGVLPVLSRAQLGEVLREIAAALAELPAEALRGRTFARVLH